MQTVERVSPRLWFTLALLCSLYVLSFVDRFILALMVEPLKADLGLGDVQIGMLFGTYFALVFGICGIPLARMADRGSRKRVIIAGVVVWSAATMASAFARNYETLIVLRMGLAFGEAALTPAALSFLASTFPMKTRVLACTLYSASGMLGAALYSVIGAGVLDIAEGFGARNDMAAWRIALVIVGAPGLILAVFAAIVMRDPPRESGGDPNALSAGFGAVWTYLKSHRRLYGGLFVAASASQALGYAIVGWAPTLLQREFGVLIKEAGYLLGPVNLVSAVGGSLTMPTILAWTSRHHPRMGAMLPTFTTGIGISLIIGSVTAGSLYVCLVLMALGMFLLTGTLNAMQIFLQLIAPVRMRATLTAMLMLCFTCIGLGVGPPVAAWAGEFYGGGIAVGLWLLAMPVLVITVSAFAVAAPQLARELERIRQEQG